MQQCNLTITTETDGKESTIRYEGEMQLASTSAELCYCEENASIRMRLNDEEALIVREGEYTLFLPLKTGEKSIGQLGISGSEGNIEIFTRKILYSINKDSAMLMLHYDLIFGSEKQRMKLRIRARKK